MIARLRVWLKRPIHQAIGSGFALFTFQLIFMIWSIWRRVAANDFRGALVPTFCAGLLLGLLGITYTILMSMRRLDEIRTEQRAFADEVNTTISNILDQEVDQRPHS